MDFKHKIVRISDFWKVSDYLLTKKICLTENTVKGSFRITIIVGTSKHNMNRDVVGIPIAGFRVKPWSEKPRASPCNSSTRIRWLK
jgi:hypothetical protein